jgi:hypothetical protein
MEGALVSSDRRINVHFTTSSGPDIGAEASAPHLVWTLASAQARAHAISVTAPTSAATTSCAAPTAAAHPGLVFPPHATCPAGDKGKARAGPPSPPPPPPLQSTVQPWRVALERARAPARSEHAGQGGGPSCPPVLPAPALGLVVPDIIHASTSVGGDPPVAGSSGTNPPQSPQVNAVS